MRQRIAIALSLTALAVSVAANSPLGHSQPRSAQAAAAPASTRAVQRLFPFFGPFRPTLWAVVKWDGTLVSNSFGVTGAARTALGQYVVSFAFSVSSCAWLATTRTMTVGGDEPFAWNASAGPLATPNQVRVFTGNENGLLFDARDSSFSLAVIC